MKYFTGLYVQCEANLGHKGGRCQAEASFTNEEGEAPYLLEEKAIEAGWFLPLSGKVRCPKCHSAEAARWKKKSLYDEHAPLSVPIGRYEAHAKVKSEA